MASEMNFLGLVKYSPLREREEGYIRKIRNYTEYSKTGYLVSNDLYTYRKENFWKTEKLIYESLKHDQAGCLSPN